MGELSEAGCHSACPTTPSLGESPWRRGFGTCFGWLGLALLRARGLFAFLSRVLATLGQAGIRTASGTFLFGQIDKLTSSL